MFEARPSRRSSRSSETSRSAADGAPKARADDAREFTTVKNPGDHDFTCTLIRAFSTSERASRPRAHSAPARFPCPPWILRRRVRRHVGSRARGRGRPRQGEQPELARPRPRNARRARRRGGHQGVQTQSRRASRLGRRGGGGRGRRRRRREERCRAGRGGVLGAPRAQTRRRARGHHLRRSRGEAPDVRPWFARARRVRGRVHGLRGGGGRR